MMQEMKDSGIKWIGEIPADWELNKIKYIAVLKGRIGWQGLTSEEYSDEGAYLITGTDFENGGINWDSCVHVPMKRWEEARDIQIENGDLLITKDGTIGKVAIVSGCDAPTSLNSGVLRISLADGYDRNFLFWVLQSEVFWSWFTDKNAGNSTIQHLYQGDFAEFKYAIPPLAEQQAIAAFLDDKCAKLDSIIADLERQIEILQEYKKSEIGHAVTKGLNPSVPMKDSGIDWIGQMPEHWNMNRIRYIADICSGATPSKEVNEYWEGDIPWVSSQEVKEDVLYDTSLHISENGMKSCSTKLMDNGTLVMVVRSGILQHTLPVALLGTPATINQDIRAFMCSDDILPAFLMYYIQGNNDILLNILMKDKSTVESIDYNLLLSCKVLLPPIDEQRNIISFLNKRCLFTNRLIDDKQAQLNTITNQKSSLIYEYVTGKKRVKEAAIHAD